MAGTRAGAVLIEGKGGFSASDRASADAPRRLGALNDLRILEVGELEAAAYCGKLFSDLGAEVIKVEPPEGAAMRRQSPLVDVGCGHAESALFAWLNTNKRSVALGAQEKDALLLQQLAQASDILIDGREGADPSWRMQMQDLNPGLTILSMSWFGESGPYRNYVGSDAVVRALAGGVWPAGEAGKPPRPLPDHQASVVAGLVAFTAGLAARFSDQTGRNFEITALEAYLALADFHLARAVAGGTPEERHGVNRFGVGFPMGIYPCREGWIGLACGALNNWLGFCELLELRDEAVDPTLRPLAARVAAAEVLEARFRPKLLERSAAEWFDLARAKGLPFAIAPDVGELPMQTVHRQRGAFADVSIGRARFEAPALPQRLTLPSQPTNGRAPLVNESGDHLRAAPPTARPRPTIPTRDRDERQPRPLEGVRVVDLTMGWAGPLATRQLADLGADVVKVESCGYPDWYRDAETSPEAISVGQFEASALFNGVNRDKRGVTLDLTRSEGVELLKRLVATADAVIENYSRDVLPKFGLGYRQLCEANASLVMVSMPAFGAGTVWGDTRAYGSTMEHAAALCSVAGPLGAPAMTHVALGDPIGGLTAATALLAALHHRRRTGEGQHVDLSQVQCLLPLLAPWSIELAVTGAVTRQDHPQLSPHAAYRCLGEDAWVFISVVDDAAWRRLCEMIGRLDLAHDLRFSHAADRKLLHQEIDDAISAWTSQHTPDEAMASLQAAGIAAGAVRRPSELISDPHLTARENFMWIDRPWIGRHPQALCAIRENGRPYAPRRAATLLGEYNDEVLGGELGLDPDALAHLSAEEIIGRTPIRSTRTRLRDKRASG